MESRGWWAAGWLRGREGVLWGLLLTYTLLLYASAYSIQFVLLWLRDEGYLASVVWSSFGVVGAVLLLALVLREPGWREVGVFFLAVGVYGLVITRLEVLQERLHLVQYGLHAGLGRAALEARWDRSRGWRRPSLVAFVLTASAGVVDELVQGVLPNRYYDVRDIVLNALAGALALAFLWLASMARHRDRTDEPSRES